MSPLIDHQQAFLLDVARLINKVMELGMVATAGELWRPQEMQDLYFRQGKTKTHDSNHTRRLALDLNIFINGQIATLAQLVPLGKYWESLSTFNRWGGNFTTIKDSPHWERNAP